MKRTGRSVLILTLLICILSGMCAQGESDKRITKKEILERRQAETETEPDWSLFAPDMMDEDGNFILDIDYIEEFAQPVCKDMIFFGDSRVVGMSYSGGSHYVGKVAAGYSWMSGEGMGLLRGKMSEYPDADIVFCFGVNDLGNIGAYIGYYQGILAQYPARRFWFLSVDPVNEGIARSNGYSVSNASIDTFNAQLEAAFPDQYIDCYHYLMGTGFSAPDGIHYGADAYLAVEDFCWREIQTKLENTDALDGIGVDEEESEAIYIG